MDASGSPVPVPPAGALTYLRACHGAALDWYKVADGKAQLIVTLNGLVVTIVTGTALAGPDEVRRRLGDTNVFALVALAAAALSVVGALVCAVMCLYSRLGEKELRALHHSLTAGAAPYALMPEVSWWFGMIASLASGERRGRPTPDEARSAVSAHLLTADDAFESRALAAQIPILAMATLQKHRWVNHGWLLTVTGLVAVVVFGVCYTVGVLA